MYNHYLFVFMFSFLILKHGTNNIFLYLTDYCDWDSSEEEEDLCQAAVEQGENKEKNANFDDDVSKCFHPIL